MRPIALAIILALTAGRAVAGTTACWFEDGAIVVPAAFGPIAGNFVLDLAAPASTLHDTVARGAGITADAARAPLTLAGRRIPDFPVAVADLDPTSRRFVAGVAGILGADAVAGEVVSIRTSPCRVSLSPSPFRRTPGSTILPARKIDGAWSVQALLTDASTVHEGSVAISTAALDVSVAGATLADREPVGGHRPIRLRALSLGGRLFEQLPAELMADPPPGLIGAVGEAVWSSFRLRLDTVRGRLELTPLRR